MSKWAVAPKTNIRTVSTHSAPDDQEPVYQCVAHCTLQYYVCASACSHIMNYSTLGTSDPGACCALRSPVASSTRPAWPACRAKHNSNCPDLPTNKCNNSCSTSRSALLQSGKPATVKQLSASSALSSFLLYGVGVLGHSGASCKHPGLAI